MELDFWKQRWEQNQIAFHLPEVNPYIDKFWHSFDAKPHSLIFIPLCGKTLDIAWFASKEFSVLGVECSEKAINDFFQEQKLKIQKNQFKQFNVYHNSNINLLQGDFFKLDKEILEDVSIVYDRASLIALPEVMRREYVELLKNTLPDETQIFLITLEYNQSQMSGPPFSVKRDEINRLFQPEFKVELLHESDVLDGHQKFKERGLTSLIECIYKITQ
ncbi:MAG: thiopurine S-methyltransferase [endosymbiont of Galathealinum brachiosum]|uniref:Thiopurine S-methyltransferase n=1 Tax=endosymbiont of Galathealinum brachiosum TaxID=2200906 RepID=A0A370DG59_9GAMM|nr:MAG: thiopurine S-methyltransferase [endosymbiont of Galathealinum brachiosum]